MEIVFSRVEKRHHVALCRGPDSGWIDIFIELGIPIRYKGRDSFSYQAPFQ